MKLRNWVAVLALAAAVGSVLSWIWSGEWNWLWTALVMLVIALGSYRGEEQ